MEYGEDGCALYVLGHVASSSWDEGPELCTHWTQSESSHRPTVL
jgi:hypothetical protein